MFKEKKELFKIFGSDILKIHQTRYNFIMHKINVLLTNANGNLSDKTEMINRAVKRAEEYVFPKLKID